MAQEVTPQAGCCAVPQECHDGESICVRVLLGALSPAACGQLAVMYCLPLISRVREARQRHAPVAAERLSRGAAELREAVAVRRLPPDSHDLGA